MYAAHAGRTEAALALIEIGAAPCVAGLKVRARRASVAFSCILVCMYACVCISTCLNHAARCVQLGVCVWEVGHG